MQRAKQSLLRLCLMAMMGVLLVASKEALAFLPNIELVTLLIILFTLVFGRLALGGVAVFLLLEGLLYGFGFWWVMYLYIWPLLVLLTFLLRCFKRAWQWALVAGVYGLCFGTLCSLFYLTMWDLPKIISWVIAGFPFDCTHAAGNSILTLLLYTPLRRALEELKKQIEPQKKSA